MYEIDLAIDHKYRKARLNYLEQLKAKYGDQLGYCKVLRERLERFVPDIDNYEEAFCDLINESYEISNGKLRIGGVYITPSTALRKCDRQAYDGALCGFANAEFESNPKNDKEYMECLIELEAAELELEELMKQLAELKYTTSVITTD